MIYGVIFLLRERGCSIATPIDFEEPAGNKLFHTQIKTSCLWWFPKIGLPPDHPFIDGFSLINHPFWVPAFMETPVYVIFSFDPFFNISFKMFQVYLLDVEPAFSDTRNRRPMQTADDLKKSLAVRTASFKKQTLVTWLNINHPMFDGLYHP